MHVAVVSTLNITRPLAPAPENALDIYKMNPVQIHTLVSLPVISVRYTNFKVLMKLLKKVLLSELSAVRSEIGENEKYRYNNQKR